MRVDAAKTTEIQAASARMGKYTSTRLSGR